MYFFKLSNKGGRYEEKREEVVKRLRPEGMPRKVHKHTKEEKQQLKGGSGVSKMIRRKGPRSLEIPSSYPELEQRILEESKISNTIYALDIISMGGKSQMSSPSRQDQGSVSLFQTPPSEQPPTPEYPISTRRKKRTSLRGSSAEASPRMLQILRHSAPPSTNSSPLIPRSESWLTEVELSPEQWERSRGWEGSSSRDTTESFCTANEEEEEEGVLKDVFGDVNGYI